MMCRVSFIPGTSLKSISTISASNTGCPSMKVYLLVWGTQQCSASAWDTCFSAMSMEIIENCSNHNISEKESAQNFQAQSSPNPVLPNQGPWYLKQLWTGGRRNREYFHLWKPECRNELWHSQIIYRKKVAGWDGIWIYEGVLTSFKAGPGASGKVWILIYSEKKVVCRNRSYEIVMVLVCRKVRAQRFIDRIFSNGFKVWTPKQYKTTGRHLLLYPTCSSECSQLVLIMQTV